MSGKSGGEGFSDEALHVDGVAADALYPVDVDRVFASVDKIESQIRKWSTIASEIQQMMHDKAADLMNSFDGRAGLLVDKGARLEINRKQARLSCDYWAISKGSPNAQNAQRSLPRRWSGGFRSVHA
ncbi:hypothetical protein [Bradyrhizobium sp. 179]|uniref:hypothetical protein n=1 Tax=Bradyrhizobium sp. 179 TaxID=2782648 RepID=UPI001FFBBCC1|nr:hypothetical protein [Bradyrhizobium sp. 179]